MIHRKTKIVCTLGPATDREGVLRDGTCALSATFEFTTRKVKDVEVNPVTYTHLALPTILRV